MSEERKSPDMRTANFIKDTITVVFSDMAALSDSVIMKNIELGCPGGFSKKDRAIDKKTADYMIKNFGYIMLGLLSNEKFRDAFKDSVAVEQTLDEKAPDFVQSIRKDMIGNEVVENGPKYLIDFSSYNDAVAEKFGKMIGDSINRIADYEDEFNDLIDHLSNEETLVVGFCVSNFMYLVRAFDKNIIFRNYVKDVLDVVIKELSN